MSKKPVLRAEQVEVIYTDERWSLLREMRQQASDVMKCLKASNIDSIVYGSIARGDVSPNSDVDVFISRPPASFIVESTLERAGFPTLKRILVQATPSYAVKACVQMDERASVSFPLLKLRRREVEFYKFGGQISIPELKSNRRVPGVDKRLMLIEPTPKGHVEYSIIGQDGVVANLLGINVDVVLERVRTLTRRNEVGRTGVFIKRELMPDENFEAVLRKLADENPAVRRRIKTQE